jgi:hypothetical protein
MILKPNPPPEEYLSVQSTLRITLVQLNPDAERIKITWANITELRDDFMKIQLAFTKPEMVSCFYKDVGRSQVIKLYRIISRT